MNQLISLPVGRAGNNIFQLYFTNYLQSKLKHFEIATFGIPDFGIPESKQFRELCTVNGDITLEGHIISEREIDDLDQLKNKIVVSKIVGMREEYLRLPPPSILDLSIAISMKSDERLARSKTHVLCHIRGGDIWVRSSYRQIHKNYPALPIRHYENICEKSGKKLLFLFEPNSCNWYRKSLLERFGTSSEVVPKSTFEDFALLSNFKEVALSVSSFAWMAVYLGRVSVVHYPVIGILNPLERPDINLLNALRSETNYYDFTESQWHGNFRNYRWLMNSSSTSR